MTQCYQNSKIEKYLISYEGLHLSGAVIDYLHILYVDKISNQLSFTDLSSLRYQHHATSNLSEKSV